MKKNFGVNAWLYPMPVLIIGSYDENGVANAMNAAWGGISLEDRISICTDDTHKTVSNILNRKAFTVHVANVENVEACDYVGIVTGNKVSDKLSKCNFITEKSSFVDAPIIKNLPMVLECEFISFDEEDCRMVGKIINVAIEEDVLDVDGKVDLEKMKPITYDPINKEYRVIGDVVAKAFGCGKKYF